MVLKDADGRIAFSIADSIPMLFLWIEFWCLLKTIFAGEGSAATVAFDRCVESFEKDGYWKKGSSNLFGLEGAFVYSALDGSKWEIESHWPKVGPSFVEVDGEKQIVYPQHLVLAAPRGMMEKLREEAHPNTAHWSMTNLFTKFGMVVDAMKHLGIRLTAEGWKNAPIGLDDFMVPSKSNGSEHGQGGGGLGDSLLMTVEKGGLHRADTKPRLTKASKIDIVKGFFQGRPQWGGTYEQLAAEIKKETWLEVSDSWLCKYRKVLGLSYLGSRARARNQTSDGEAVSREPIPGEQLEVFSMPVDPER